jgi:transcriptional regulator with XRE-family HTH domain
MESVYEDLGRNIRRARLHAGLTQEQLGRAVGLARTSVNNIEHGRQKVLVHTLFELASACQVTPESLLVREQAAAPVPPDVRDWIERIRVDG